MKKVINFIITMLLVLTTTISCDEAGTDSNLKWHRENKNGEKINEFKLFRTMSFFSNSRYWISHLGDEFMVKDTADNWPTITIICKSKKGDECRNWFKKNGIDVLSSNCCVFILPRKNVYTTGERYFFMEFKSTLPGRNWAKITEYPFIITDVYKNKISLYSHSISDDYMKEWLKKHEIYKYEKRCLDSKKQCKYIFTLKRVYVKRGEEAFVVKTL